ncbi:hypothetical protein SAMN05216343_11638 [Oscillibacter sp. PC13]|uniref:hypothetical protein n=1 Tax=Oscillibacter sp. PC13 TaxID=1855299 RepID=UPI0008E8A3D7|nr:hypothetical protein [Oscillibacter sp. PC13]SFP84910.1 hypothetical protein SAMN05216343_11638 [Oscillibacter sp. PC13]
MGAVSRALGFARVRPATFQQILVEFLQVPGSQLAIADLGNGVGFKDELVAGGGDSANIIRLPVASQTLCLPNPRGKNFFSDE